VPLDQDDLAVGLLHDRQVKGPLGLARLPGVVAVDVLGAELLADQHGRDHEQQPAEHDGLAVAGRPPGHSFNKGCPYGLRLMHGETVLDPGPAGPWCDLPKTRWG
jgi:hypothetical protein